MLGGISAYQSLPLEAFPDVANMQVRVITQVPGKAPEEVERLVTVPIEKEVNGIPHSKSPRSISIFGLSVVTIVFEDHTDPYTARQQVLERISHADLPEEISPELDPNASPVGEIYRYTIQGKHWSAMDKKEVQDWLLNRLFKSVSGIVESTGFGGPTRIFLVELDPGRARAFGISHSQVAQAIAKSNDSTGGSYIISNHQRYMVRGLGLLKNAHDLSNVVISSNKDGTPIRVRDLAKVQITSAVRKGQVGLNDDDDVVEGILMMTRGENPSEVIANLRESWDEIAEQVPEGMKLEPLYDRMALVTKTVETIGHNVGEGVVLVVAILLLFLFQVRAALICSIVIPSALLGACIVLKTCHIPANLLSLGAIDFGIIVDGAVVVVENISKALKNVNSNSSEELSATISAAVSEVGKSILFGTAIIGMTFLPILSFEHVEGRLFKPLAILMNLNLLCAALCTILVVPVICYLVFSVKPASNRESPLSILMEHLFEKLVPQIQRHANVILVSFICVCVFAASLVPQLGAEFIPELEEGNIWLRVTVLPPSVSLEKSVEMASQIRAIVQTYPETGNVLTQIGSPDDGTDPNPYNMIEVLIDLKPQETWRAEYKTKEKLVSALDKEINHKLPGVVCNFSQYIKDNMEEAMSGVKNGEFAVKVFGPNLVTLEDIAQQISQIMRGTEGFVDVAHDLLLGQPQISIEIDREQAARVGVSADEILDVVETAIGGKVVSRLIEEERRFDVVLRVEKHFREDPKKIGEILVTTPSGPKIPLKQIATIKQTDGANTILRENNRRRIAVYGNIRGRDLGSAALDAQKQITAKIKLPVGYKMSFAGEFERARQAGQRLAIVVPITLLLILCLLYFVFDSMGLALLSMSAAPVAAVVAIIVLFLSGTHISVSSGVGLIALSGLSIQNAVIIISRLRDLLKEGLDLPEAVKVALVSKMNAIVIAALVAAVGLIPAALSNGIGAQSQKPFATVIAFGIVPTTLLILFLVPALAPLCLHSWKKKKELVQLEEQATT